MLIRLSEAVDFLENQKPFQKDFGGSVVLRVISQIIDF